METIGSIPPIIKGNGFKQMFELQKGLLKEYMVLENLPPYPIDINTKAGQRLIKDFIRKYVEELSEAFQEMVHVLESASSNQLEKAKGYAEEFNMELADATHFLLEILIYSGLEENEISNLTRNKMDLMGISNLYEEGNPLGSLFRLANYTNVMAEIAIPKSQEFKVHDQQEVMNRPEFGGCKTISQKGLKTHSLFLWGITHTLFQAANQLKNKEWSQTEKKVNEVQYIEKLFYALTQIFQYWDFVGLTELGVFHAYFIKNRINHERIKNGY